MKRYLLLIVLAACHPVPTPAPVPPDADASPTPVPTPVPAQDAAPLPPPTPNSLCSLDWQKIGEFDFAHRCGVKIPKTGTWVQACENAEAHGINMHTQCVLDALTCAAVKVCLGEK